MTRILSTGSTAIVDHMISSLRDLIDREYAQVLKRKLDDVYKMNGQGSNATKAEKAERDNRQTFIVSRYRFMETSA